MEECSVLGAFQLIPSFSSTSQLVTKEVQKEVDSLVPQESSKQNGCFILKDIISKDESKCLVEESEKNGFQSLNWGSARLQYRVCDRLIFDDPALTSSVWNRVKAFLPSTIEIKKGDQWLGYGLEGTWTLTGLNQRWRLVRYQPGGHFLPHADGCYIINENTRSFLTLMLYLNEEFDDGCTNFLSIQTEQLRGNENGKGQDINLKLNPKDKLIKVLKVKPATGSGVVFFHPLFHEGEDVLNGKKYIMRTDVMYTRDVSTCTEKSEEEKKAIEYLKIAEELETSGRAFEAAEFYKKAFKLSKDLAAHFNS